MHGTRELVPLTDSDYYTVVSLKLEIILIIMDHFYIALFSALEQFHCALIASDSK